MPLAAVPVSRVIGAPIRSAIEPRGDLSFAQAQQMQRENSPALSGQNRAVEASRAQARALGQLGGPVVSLSANWLRYQKTFDVSLNGVRNQVDSGVSRVLSNLPSQFPPELQPVASQIGSQISQALPDLLGVIPDSIRFTERDTVLRPSLTAVWPFYTGGADQAVQQAAQATVAAAESARAGAQTLAQLELVHAYFGLQAASQLVAASEETLTALQTHHDNALRMQMHGVLPRARVLEVEVTRDAAQRVLDRARLQQDNARDNLARVLALDAPAHPSTPLFVRADPLPPLEEFLASARRERPEIRAAEAQGAAAAAARQLAASAWRPQAYLFGSYNLNRHHAVPIDPDWMVGVGVRFTLVSNVDRQALVGAAQLRQQAADDAVAAARRQTGVDVSRAWNQVELARRTFLSLESSLIAARENLRVQAVSFREGVGTSSDVISAQSALSQVQTQRVSAAYEYDLALAALLALSGRDDEFLTYLAQAEHRLPKINGAQP
nr:TolC family protein [Ottowia sp.]